MRNIATVMMIALFLCFVPQSEASMFTVWADSTGDGLKDLILGQIQGYEGALSGRDNYNYFSFSGHPIEGASPHKNRLKIFVYERTTNDRDFLNIIAGKDNGGTEHSFDLQVLISGSTLNPQEVRGDENHEFNETSDNLFSGDWWFRNNSDGGVIGRLKGDWEAKITMGDSTLNRHVFTSDGTSNIRVDTLPYSTYFIAPCAVPEPATMALFGFGLAGAFVKRRKQD